MENGNLRVKDYVNFIYYPGEWTAMAYVNHWLRHNTIDVMSVHVYFFQNVSDVAIWFGLVLWFSNLYQIWDTFLIYSLPWRL